MSPSVDVVYIRFAQRCVYNTGVPDNVWSHQQQRHGILSLLLIPLKPRISGAYNKTSFVTEKATSLQQGSRESKSSDVIRCCDGRWYSTVNARKLVNIAGRSAPPVRQHYASSYTRTPAYPINTSRWICDTRPSAMSAACKAGTWSTHRPAWGARYHLRGRIAAADDASCQNTSRHFRPDMLSFLLAGEPWPRLGIIFRCRLDWPWRAAADSHSLSASRRAVRLPFNSASLTQRGTAWRRTAAHLVACAHYTTSAGSYPIPIGLPIYAI